MKKLYYSISLFIISLLIYLQCDIQISSNISTEKIQYMPALNLRHVSIPNGMIQAQDTIVQFAVDLLKFQHGIADCTALFKLPLDSLESGPPWQHEWANSANVENKLIVDERIINDNELEYSFDLWYNGYDSINSTNYNNRHIIGARTNQSADDISLYLYVTDNFLDALHYRYESDGSKGEYHQVSLMRSDDNIYKNCDYFRIVFSYAYDYELNSQYNLMTGGGLMTFTIADSIYYKLRWGSNGRGTWESSNNEGETVDSGAW